MKPSKPTNIFSKHSRVRRRRQTIEELRSLQRLMAGAVMRPLMAGRKMNPQWTDGSSTSRAVAKFITPNSGLSSFERLQLYNRQYWFRLLDCFREDFPGLRSILGERRFGRLAEMYLAAHPSRSFTMRNIGRELIRFIEEHPEQVSPHEHLALDMARLEWAHVEAFDNIAEPIMTAEDLADADPSKLRLRLQPYLILLRVSHAVDVVSIQVRRPEGLRSETSNAVARKRPADSENPKRVISRTSIHLAVHRHQNSVYYKRLRPVEFALLSALRQGLTLEQAVTEATESPRARTLQPAQLTECFQSWSSLGWFCRNRSRTPSTNGSSDRRK